MISNFSVSNYKFITFLRIFLIMSLLLEKNLVLFWTTDCEEVNPLKFVISQI